MPPVQEQLLLTDTEKAGHQGVQGLRRKKVRLRADFYFNKPGNTRSLESLPLSVRINRARINRTLYNTRLRGGHAEVGISQTPSDNDGGGII